MKHYIACMGRIIKRARVVSIQTQPVTRNNLSQLGLEFRLERAPNLVYHVTRVVLPDVSMNKVEVPTPFKLANFEADKLQYGDLQVTFKVDEEMANWAEIYDWMVGLGFPNKFEQKRLLVEKGRKELGRGVTSTASLIIMTSSKNPNIEFKFNNIIPINITSIDFNVGSSDVEYVECTVTFDYQDFEVIKYQ